MDRKSLGRMGSLPLQFSPTRLAAVAPQLSTRRIGGALEIAAVSVCEIPGVSKTVQKRYLARGTNASKCLQDRTKSNIHKCCGTKDPTNGTTQDVIPKFVDWLQANCFVTTTSSLLQDGICWQYDPFQNRWCKIQLKTVETMGLRHTHTMNHWMRWYILTHARRKSDRPPVAVLRIC